MSNFEEWFKTKINNDQYGLAYDNRDMQTIRRHYENRKESMKEAWDHQQKEIDRQVRCIDSLTVLIKDMHLNEAAREALAKI